MNTLLRRGLHLGLGVAAASFATTAIVESSGEILEAKGPSLAFLPDDIRADISDRLEDPTEKTLASLRGIGGIAAAAFSPNAQPTNKEGVAYRNFAIGALLLAGVAVPSMIIGLRGHR